MAYQKKVQTYEESRYVKETMLDIEQLPIAHSKERGITKETCERFNVRMSISETDGKTPTAYFFPYYDSKGKLSGWKKRDLTVDKHDRQHFSVIGKVGVDCKMFGQQVAESINRKHTSLYTCEGEWDTLSIFQAMKDQVSGTKYEGMEPFVVSLACGTANAVESMLHNEGFVKSFQKITLCFDNDRATQKERDKGIKRGVEATEDVASAFIGDNLYCVEYAADMKDPSDYVQAGRSRELAKLLQFEAKRFVTEKIVYASDISFEELISKRENGLMIPQFPALMEKIRGFRKSELVLLTSGVGTGKSTVTSNFAAGIIEAGERVGLIFLEETRKETLQRLVANKLKVNFNHFKENPTSCASQEDIKAAYDSIVEDDRAVFLDHFGYLNINELMNKIRHMHFVSKCSYIILDHLTLCTSGGNVDDERKEIDRVMTELASFCASNPVCIIAISHINRGNYQDNKPPKDADENPYWVKVDKSHMRGSSALEALSWIILGLEGQVMPDRSRGNVRLTVLKNRPYGLLGVADEFKLNPRTWEVELVQDEGF